MDNDAFTDLVRGRIKGKTSKEVAREAVEDEFRRKKRKRGGRGGNDDYSSSDDDDSETRSKKSKPKPTVNDISLNKRDEDADKTKNDELSSKYRDRAKERREGTRHDEQVDQDDIIGSSATVNKGGGGEKKGLDIELVRKRRREIMEQQGKSLTSNRKEQGDVEERSERESIVTSTTIDEARDFLNTLVQSRDEAKKSSDETLVLAKRVGPDMLDSIEQILQSSDRISKPKAGAKPEVGRKQVASRASTYLAFALDGHPSDKVRAWEAPRVFTTHHERSMKQHEDENDSHRHVMATPIDSGLIRTMELIFARSCSGVDMVDSGSLNAKEATTKSKVSSPQAQTSNDKPGDNEENDDDDIFGDVGDYIPPSAKTLPTTSGN